MSTSHTGALHVYYTCLIVVLLIYSLLHLAIFKKCLSYWFIFESGLSIKDKLFLKALRSVIIHFLLKSVDHHVHWFALVCAICSYIVAYLKLTLVNDATGINKEILFTLLRFTVKCLLKHRFLQDPTQTFPFAATATAL